VSLNAEDGKTIVVTLTTADFAAAAEITASRFTVNGLQGVTVGSVARTSAKIVTITLSGNSTDIVRTRRVHVTVAKEAVASATKNHVAFAELDINTSVISGSTTSTVNHTQFTITLLNGTFREAADGAITASDFIFTGGNDAELAAGTFTRTSPTVVTITNLVLEASSDDVVTVKPLALATSTAASVTVTGASVAS
jgi:hypothetical protein